MNINWNVYTHMKAAVTMLTAPTTHEIRVAHEKNIPADDVATTLRMPVELIRLAYVVLDFEYFTNSGEFRSNRRPTIFDV